jgi:hypothetical protein
MKLKLVAVVCSALALLAFQSSSYAEVSVTSTKIYGWFSSLEDADDDEVEGNGDSLCVTDETMVYYRMEATVTWDPECYPIFVKLKMYEEDDLSADDFIGDGISGSQANPVPGWHPFGFHKFKDFICTSGKDLADKAGSSGEPGSEWELEVRVCYTLNGTDWNEIDPPGWEFDQPFHGC